MCWASTRLVDFFVAWMMVTIRNLEFHWRIFFAPNSWECTDSHLERILLTWHLAVVFHLQRWVRFHQNQLLHARVSNTNGVELQHEYLKYSFLTDMSGGSLTELVVAVVQKLVPASERKYATIWCKCTWNYQSIIVLREQMQKHCSHCTSIWGDITCREMTVNKMSFKSLFTCRQCHWWRHFWRKSISSFCRRNYSRFRHIVSDVRKNNMLLLFNLTLGFRQNVPCKSLRICSVLKMQHFFFCTSLLLLIGSYTM